MKFLDGGTFFLNKLLTDHDQGYVGQGDASCSSDGRKWQIEERNVAVEIEEHDDFGNLSSKLCQVVPKERKWGSAIP